MTQHQSPRVLSRILVVLDEHDGEVQGTERLAIELGLLSNKKYVIHSTRRLAADDEISITPSCGGRGKKTIYKRNRNQPGLARKTI